MKSKNLLPRLRNRKLLIIPSPSPSLKVNHISEFRYHFLLFLYCLITDIYIAKQMI